MRFDHRELAAIFAGGAIGALARVWLALHIVQGDTSWPWTIFAINVCGAFLLGYFVTRLQECLPLSTYRRPLLGTGFCGAFTTFSTMEVELLKMVQANCYGLALAYAAASLAAGLTAIWLASTLVRRGRF